jgi:hypothetical protein
MMSSITVVIGRITRLLWVFRLSSSSGTLADHLSQKALVCSQCRPSRYPPLSAWTRRRYEGSRRSSQCCGPSSTTPVARSVIVLAGSRTPDQSIVILRLGSFTGIRRMAGQVLISQRRASHRFTIFNAHRCLGRTARMQR